MRHYKTFCRDFGEIVENSKNFTNSELSLVLRNECLQGSLRALVHNVYDYRELWAKLDERYDDEDVVVESVMEQIINFKPISESDMSGFINYVETLEKAHYDLVAYGLDSVLSNMTTTTLVMRKCPPWIQLDITKAISLKKPLRKDEFSFMLNRLIELKKQARRLEKYMEKKPVKVDPVPGSRQRAKAAVAEGVRGASGGDAGKAAE